MANGLLLFCFENNHFYFPLAASIMDLVLYVPFNII